MRNERVYTGTYLSIVKDDGGMRLVINGMSEQCTTTCDGFLEGDKA